VIVIDTHVLVWFATTDKKLGRKSRALLERAWASDEVSVSAISFWEIAILESRGRLSLPAGAGSLRTSLLEAGLTEIAVDGEIALRAVELAGLPSDPADRLIAATALCHQGELLTADDNVLDWRHTLPRHDARL
jgi:PIN domain nuclease of toxin-antitoxin system